MQAVTILGIVSVSCGVVHRAHPAGGLKHLSFIYSSDVVQISCAFVVDALVG